MKKLIFGAMVGAALAYMFDPQDGARRRERLQEMLGRPGARGPAAPDVPVDLLIVDERTRVGVS